MDKRVLILSLLIFIVLFMPKVVVAEDNSIYIKADHLPSFWEKVKEKFSLYTTFSKAKKSLYLEELEKKRYGEIRYVFDSGQGDLMEETTSRYSTSVGQLGNFVLNNKISSKKDELMKLLTKQQEDLGQYLLKVEAGSGFWRLISYDIDTDKLYIKKLKSI